MAEVMDDRSRRDRGARFSDTSRDRSRDRGGGGGRASKASTNRVYVSNIPYEFRWQDLKDLFRSNVGDVSFVELFVDENEKSRGCGIVEFANEELAAKCLEVMQRHEIKGRRLVVKEDVGNARDKYGNLITPGAVKRGRRDEGMYSEDRYDTRVLNAPESKWGNTYGLSANFLESLRIDSPLCCRVFVANLQYNVDEKKLREVFRLAGHVWNVDLHTDKDGNSRGFAVVEFDHPVEAVQAISMFHNQVLNDRVMTVRMDRVNEVLRLPEGLKSVGMGLGSNGEPLRDIARNLPNTNDNKKSDQPTSFISDGATNGTGGNLASGMFGAAPNAQVAAQVASALNTLGTRSGNNSTLNPQSLLQATNLASLLSTNGMGGDLSALTANLSGALAAQLRGFGSGGSVAPGTGDIHATPQRTYDNESRNMHSINQFNDGSSYLGNQNSTSLKGTINTAMLQPTLSRNDNILSNMGESKQATTNMSRSVLATNFPPNAGLQMLRDKFEEYGDVLNLVDAGNGAMLITYSSTWQAKRAIQNLDGARINGYTINACFHF